MLIFCGQEHCLIDSNGRLKLPQRFIDDFTLRCGGEVVMHGLPEGAVALYPEEVYREMREREVEAVDSIGSSFAARRSPAGETHPPRRVPRARGAGTGLRSLCGGRGNRSGNLVGRAVRRGNGRHQ